MIAEKPDAEPIPGALNLALAAGASTAAVGLLVFASWTPSWGWRIAAAVAFSYVNNTIFSLLLAARAHPRGMAHLLRRVRLQLELAPVRGPRLQRARRPRGGLEPCG